MSKIVNAEIKIGEKFRGDNNGAIIEVLRFEGTNIVYKVCKTGKIFSSGLETFKRCGLTRLKAEEDIQL